MMLSEGRPLVDDVFSLYEGVVRLELDRPTYERCGLQGKPIEDGGKKHKKSRWGAYLFSTADDYVTWKADCG
jgi:ribonuclease P/MRP protein subunit RPP40